MYVNYKFYPVKLNLCLATTYMSNATGTNYSTNIL